MWEFFGCKQADIRVCDAIHVIKLILPLEGYEFYHLFSPIWSEVGFFILKAKMKITNTKIYDTVKEVVGEDSLKVVEFLKDKKNISDFKIAEKVKTDIHEIRNILYRLYNHNLVSYYRKKDRQKGWYISYWTFNKKRIKDLMKNLHYSKVERFTERLKIEEANRGNFYLCPNACVRVNFEKATDFEFKCPECGVILNHQDNGKTIEFLQGKIKELHATNGFAKMGNGFAAAGDGFGNGHSIVGNGHSNGNGHKINSVTRSNKVVRKAKSSRKKR